MAAFTAARGKIIQNSSWMQIERNCIAVEQLLEQMESFILLPPRPKHGLHDDLLNYLDFIDTLLKSDAGAQAPSKCLQIEQVGWRAARLWALVPHVDHRSALCAALKRAFFSSCAFLLSINIALMTPLLEDIVSFMRNTLLISELQGQPGDRGTPQVRCFRHLEAAVVDSLNGGHTEDMRIAVVVELPTQAHSMRCQTYTSTFLGNFLKYSHSASVLRCIEHGTLARLWTVIATHLVSSTSLLPVRAGVLRLISNHLVQLSPSPHSIQTVFLAVIHGAAHLRAGSSTAQPDDALSVELNRALRVLVPLLTQPLAAEVLPSIVKAVATMPNEAVEEESSSTARLHRTLLWCLQCTTAAATAFLGRTSASISRFSSAPAYTYEVTACRAAMLVSDPAVCQAFASLSTSAEAASSSHSSTAVVGIPDASFAMSSSRPAHHSSCDIETKRTLEVLWAVSLEALVENDVRDPTAHLCLTCSALHTYAIAVWNTAKSEEKVLPSSSLAANLLEQLRTTGELELAHDMPGEAGADPMRLILLVDTALILVHYLKGHNLDDKLVLTLVPIVKLAVQCLRKHCMGEAAVKVLSSKRASTQIPSSLVADSSSQYESLKVARVRDWNTLAQVLGRPLWERCLQLVCLAGVALVDSKDTTKEESRRAVIGSFVTLMAEATPEASVAIILQLPGLVQTLLPSSALKSTEPRATATHPDASAVLWLKPFFAWALPELRNGAIVSRQPCIAFVIGLLARLCCTPGIWKLTAGTCPRPVLLRPPDSLSSISDALDSGSKMGASTGEASRWKPFNIFWQQVAPSVHATTEAAKSDLVRALAAVLRHATRQQLEAPAPKLSDAVQIHWSLMLESTTSPSLRATLAHEASVLFTSGSKVLSLLENGACAATQGSPVVESGALTQGGFLHQLGENFSQTAGTSSGGSTVSGFTNGQEYLAVALGTLASSIDFSAIPIVEGRKLLLWSVTRLLDLWSAPHVPIHQRLGAYHQLEGLPSVVMQHLDKVLRDEESTPEKVSFLAMLLDRQWLEPFTTLFDSRAASIPRFLRKVLLWLVPELVAARRSVLLKDLATELFGDDRHAIPRVSSAVNSRLSAASAGGKRSSSSGRRSGSSGRRSSISAGANGREMVQRMLFHEAGLMERVLVHLLMVPHVSTTTTTSLDKSMSRQELQQRGEFLVELLPEQENFEGLLRGFNTYRFHWHLVWELSGARASNARRALRAVAALSMSKFGDDSAGGDERREDGPERKKQRGGRLAPASSSAGASSPQQAERQRRFGEDCVAVETWAEEHFLGLVFQITFEWAQQSLAVQKRRLRTLKSIFNCLPGPRLARFVPKIMAILLPCLADDAPPELTATASSVLTAFAGMLDDDTAQEHLSTMVVAVLPLLERSDSSSSGVVSNCEINIYSTTGEDVDGSDALSMLYSAQQSASQLLRLLIIDRAAALAERFPTIPFEIKSALPELQPVRHALVAAHGTPSLAEELGHLVALLRHDSVSIKRTTLIRLLEVLQGRRSDLVALVQGTSPIVAQLLQELFQVCARSTDSEARLGCAKCLGCIGAIDPSQVTLVAESQGQTSGISRETPPPPWTVTRFKFIMCLITRYLAAALRGSSSVEGQGATIQDRVGYAIQTLLKIVREDLLLDKEAPMPQDLATQFAEAGVLDVVRPLWASGYELKEVTGPRPPPFLKRGCTFTRWLAQLSRYLIEKSKGPFQAVFQACRGAVKTCSALAQFLLPYLVLDGLSFGHDSDNEAVLEEILTALRDDAHKAQNSSSDENELQSSKAADGSSRRGFIEPVLVQAVFALHETLEQWLAQGAAPKRSFSRQKQQPVPEAEWPMQLEDIERFAQGIPVVGLARAAVRIKAYTRSLRYLETIARSRDSTDRGSSGSRGAGSMLSGSAHIRRDACTVTERLPKPTWSDVDKMQLVYGHLDEPDGMGGLEVLWHALAQEPRPLQRIRALEHAEQWSAALQEYETVMQEIPATGPAEGRLSIENGASSKRTPLSNVMEEDDGDDDDIEFEAWESEGGEGALEHGMLRSLLVLGHLESVLNQYDGLAQHQPHLKPTVAPVAVSAAWRLQRWHVMDRCLGTWDDAQGSEEGRFEVALAKTLHALELCRRNAATPTAGLSHIAVIEKEADLESAKLGFEKAVRAAREQVMDGLAAASRESYQRAYPLLLRLHVLSEAEQGVALVVAKPAERRRLVQEQDWTGRLSLMGASLRDRAPILAVRRVIFTMAQMPELAGEDLLAHSKLARVGGNFTLAKNAWRAAAGLMGGMSRGRLVIAEAKLLHCQGQLPEALKLIEPSDMEMASVRRGAERQRSRSRDQAFSTSEVEALKLQTKRLLYATDWKVEAGHIHGDPVLELYALARAARPDWPRAAFSTAKYYDLLLSRRREAYRDKDATDPTVHELAKHAVEHYCESLRVDSKYLFQAMPRLLTLWFDFSLVPDVAPGDKPSRSSSSSGRSSNAKAAARSSSHASSERTPLRLLQGELNKIVRKALATIPPHLWYSSLQQLISRVGHFDSNVVDIVVEALVRIAVAHSRETVWSVAQLLLSNNEARRKAGSAILSQTTQQLSAMGKEQESKAFGNARHLFADLIKHAQFQTNEKKCVFKLTRSMNMTDYVVPNQQTLTVALRPRDAPARGGDAEGSSSLAQGAAASRNAREKQSARHDPFPNGGMRISKFQEQAVVMNSKARPKKMTLDTTRGETVNYLCKQEKNGDLRKDARLMEFNAVVNRVLARDVAGRHRRLKLRTYAVVCLNEECGLLEWVPQTAPIRTLFAEAYACHPPIENPRFSSPSVRDAFTSLQSESRASEMATRFRKEVFGQFTPCFHRWFLQRFLEPTAWFEARTAYTRSVAVWSAVGHVVGLGDRHCENILIDMACGEAVHVDFDCLFDKGVTLNRPEVVPFRLTSHMVEGMGPTGYEGLFRGCMEVTLSVLREHQETLVSVLEPFLHDPTVGWDRQGRAQRPDEDVRGAGRGAASSSGGEMDPKRVLATVKGRLKGVYNLRDSHAWDTRSRSSRPKPPTGVSDSALEFSVQGQVQRLILEATHDENLAQMYVGWMPWY